MMFDRPYGILVFCLAVCGSLVFFVAVQEQRHFTGMKNVHKTPAENVHWLNNYEVERLIEDIAKLSKVTKYVIDSPDTTNIVRKRLIPLYNQLVESQSRIESSWDNLNTFKQLNIEYKKVVFQKNDTIIKINELEDSIPYIKENIATFIKNIQDIHSQLKNVDKNGSISDISISQQQNLSSLKESSELTSSHDNVNQLLYNNDDAVNIYLERKVYDSGTDNKGDITNSIPERDYVDSNAEDISLGTKIYNSNKDNTEDILNNEGTGKKRNTERDYVDDNAEDISLGMKIYNSNKDNTEDILNNEGTGEKSNPERDYVDGNAEDISLGIKIYNSDKDNTEDIWNNEGTGKKSIPERDYEDYVNGNAEDISLGIKIYNSDKDNTDVLYNEGTGKKSIPERDYVDDNAEDISLGTKIYNSEIQSHTINNEETGSMSIPKRLYDDDNAEGSNMESSDQYLQEIRTSLDYYEVECEDFLNY